MGWMRQMHSTIVIQMRRPRGVAWASRESDCDFELIGTDCRIDVFSSPFYGSCRRYFLNDEYIREIRARPECCARAAIDRFILSEVTASSHFS